MAGASRCQRAVATGSMVGGALCKEEAFQEWPQWHGFANLKYIGGLENAPRHCAIMRDFLHLTLPSLCAFCRAWPVRGRPGRICHDCLRRFACCTGTHCRQCALPVPAGVTVCGQCLQTPPLLSRCVAAVPYAYPWHHAIAQFKFHDDTAWAATMAGIMLQQPAASQLLASAHVALPVPLSPQRLRERGYNQAQLLAQNLLHQAGGTANRLQILCRGITRRHRPQHQAQLSRAQRLRSLNHVFAITEQAMPALHGRHVLLVDDVKTTGATLDALASACLQAGAAHVSALVFAFTPAA